MRHIIINFSVAILFNFYFFNIVYIEQKEKQN